MIVSLTDEAKSKIRQLLNDGEMSSPEIRLISGCAGCGGLSVGLSINESRRANDKVLNTEGVSILIDEESGPYISDTVVDYKDNEYGGNFIVSNEYGSSVCFV